MKRCLKIPYFDSRKSLRCFGVLIFILIGSSLSHCRSKLDPSLTDINKNKSGAADNVNSSDSPPTLPTLPAAPTPPTPDDTAQITNSTVTIPADSKSIYSIDSKDVLGPDLIFSGKIILSSGKQSTSVLVDLVSDAGTAMSMCYHQSTKSFGACPGVATAVIDAEHNWLIAIPKALFSEASKYVITTTAVDESGAAITSSNFSFRWLENHSSEPTPASTPTPTPSALPADLTPPSVLQVTSSAPAGIFSTSDVVPIQVVFSELVFVTGIPQITLTIGGTARTVDYAGGSGTDTLTFNYVVQPGDVVAQLDYASTNALSVNGGTIKDATANDAVVGLAVPGQTGSLAANKSISVDGAAPSIPIGLVTAADSSSGADSRYDDDTTSIFFAWQPAVVASSTIRDYTLTWYSQSNCAGTAVEVPGLNSTNYSLSTGLNAAATYSFKVRAYSQTGLAGSESLCSGGITIDTSASAPPLSLVTAGDAAGGSDVRFDDDLGSIFFAWAAASDAQSGIRDYTLSLYNQINCGGTATVIPNITATNYVLNSGLANSNSYSFKVQAFNNAGLGSSLSNCSGNIVIDTSPPSAPTGLITAADGTGGADTRYDDDNAAIFLVWTAASDAQSGIRDYTISWYSQANCGGSATVVPGISGTNYSLSSGLSSGTTYSFKAEAFNQAGGGSGQSICSGNITIDTSAPTVASVGASNSNATFTVGSTIGIQVVFNETVIVTGTPQLTLATGTPATVNYVSGSNSTTLLFNYTVAASHQSSDLNYSATNALTLNSGTIKDSVGNNAILTLPALASSLSLAGTKDIVIDTTAPNQPATLTTSNSADSTLLMNWTAGGGGGESGYILVRRVGSAVTWTPTPGATYSAGVLDVNHSLVYSGSNLTFTDAALVSGTTYYYTLWSYDVVKNYSVAKTTSGIASMTPKFTQIAAGYEHSCGLSADGKAWCWGNRQYGKIGNGTTSGTESKPTAVDTSAMTGDKSFIQISTAQYHTCALTSEGKAWCWGRELYGELGNGATLTTDQAIPTAVDTAAMSGEKAFVQITTGSMHTCALTAEGNAWCWGEDSGGKLGHGGAAANRDVPTAVDTAGMTGSKIFTQLSAGYGSTCGVTSDGKVWCWGQDADGQLGNGSGVSGSQSSPTALDISSMTGGKGFKLVEVGKFYSSHACALTVEGKAWCWGLDTYGQLGDGALLTGAQTSPSLVALSGMTGAKAFTQLSVNYNHTCGLTAEGKAWCWGYDSAGELGNGSTTANQDTPAAVDVSGISGEKSFTQIVSGYSYSCGITTDGKGWCWGNDGSGQLGNGPASSTMETPVAVDMTLMSGAVGFVQISTGYSHTCGVTSNGKALCWGYNDYFKLGDGSSQYDSIYTPSPVDISSMTGDKFFVQIVAGGYHTCALTAEGKAWCWGYDGNGQLGNGAALTATQSVPSAVDISGMTGETSFVQLSAGADHNCGLTTEGKLWCWGSGDHGQLGNGTLIGVSKPVAVDTSVVTGEKIFKQLFAGYSGAGGSYSCALTSEGKAWCWGSDAMGQLGNGAGLTGDQTRPTAVDVSGVSGEKTFVQINVGDQHACALTQEGKAWCWGTDTNGALGNGAGVSGTQVSPTAVNIAGMSNEKAFVQISPGRDMSCGLTSQGKIWCWGSDTNGRLGNGSIVTADQENPSNILDITSMSGEKSFTQISASYSHACAITGEGKTWCWGWGGYGQIGNNAAATDNASPLIVNTSAL